MHEICCKIPFDIFNLKLNLGNQRLKVSPTFTSLATILAEFKNHGKRRWFLKFIPTIFLLKKFSVKKK